MSGVALEFEGLGKRFGDFAAVHPLNLSVAPGELLVLLGPSGCGKTTTLRMTAGLEFPSEGRILFDGKDVTRKPPGERDVAFVFQLYALYPHMTVGENVAFPLRTQGRSAVEASRAASAMLERLGLGMLAGSKPRQLSGADQQRAALARALVRKPRAFLLDEPLNTLDSAQREFLREQIRELHKEMEATTLFVTHDQAEALALGDRIAVMGEGKILQCGPPREVYENPNSLFVANFLGTPGMNFLFASRSGEAVRVQGADWMVRVSDLPDSKAGLGEAWTNKDGLYLGIRPEHVLLTGEGAPCQVEHTEMLGAYSLVDLRAGKVRLKARVPGGRRYREGDTVGVSFHPSGCRWFDAVEGNALPWHTQEVKCTPSR